MSWVERGGRLYEYRSVRRGGRVTSEYLGRPFDNDLATMMADLESNVREIERLEVAELREDRDRRAERAGLSSGRRLRVADWPTRRC